MVEPISVQLNAPNLAALRGGLEELGYVEGRNFVFDYRSADGNAALYPGLVAEVISRNPELVWFVVPYASTKAVLGSLFFGPHIPSEAPLLLVGWTLIFEMFFYVVLPLHCLRSGVSQSLRVSPLF